MWSLTLEKWGAEGKALGSCHRLRYQHEYPVGSAPASTLPEKSAISQKAGKVSCRMELAHDSFEERLLFTTQLKQQTFTLESVEARVQGRGVAKAPRQQGGSVSGLSPGLSVVIFTFTWLSPWAQISRFPLRVRGQLRRTRPAECPHCGLITSLKPHLQIRSRS